MQQKRIITAVASLAALTISATSFAFSFNQNMSISNGWYIEGDIGSSSLTNKSYPGSASSSGWGGGGSVGYKFMPYVGVEGGYTRYANTSIKDSVGTKVATDKHYSYDLAAKGILPIYCTGAELFAKLGIGRMNSKVSVNNEAGAFALGISSSNHSATSVYVGAGAQYYLIPELAVVVAWARQQGNSQTGNLDLFYGGINFIIG